MPGASTGTILAVYRELTAADHRRVLGLRDEPVPDLLILLGVFDVESGGARWADYLGLQRMRRYPAWTGEAGGLRVALAACLGGPMAAVHVHTWCGAGVPAVVQTGWYGALQHGTALGDVVVPHHAERQDGVSDWYLPKGILADATPALADGIAARLRAGGVTVHERAIFSTPALLAESREVVADWSRHGWHGVDMETAATFAVAKALGAQRAAALIRFDDLVAEEDSLTERMPAERLAAMRAREPEVLAAVVAAAAESLRGRERY
jgi:uridine phosphorylase